MKKIISLLLVLAMVMALAACGASKPAETAPAYEWSSLSAAEQAALKAVMPVALPDFSSYEIVTRAMSFDSGIDDYVIAGNSKGSTTFVSEVEGAVYGQAVKMKACNDAGDNRAEIEVTPLGDMDISTAKGVMFYVDFSNIQMERVPDF